jgi:hypothetical protein
VTLFKAYIEGPRYTFEAYGETPAEAERARGALFRRWTDGDPYLWSWPEMVEQCGPVFTVEVGRGFGLVDAGRCREERGLLGRRRKSA